MVYPNLMMVHMVRKGNVVVPYPVIRTIKIFMGYEKRYYKHSYNKIQEPMSNAAITEKKEKV